GLVVDRAAQLALAGLEVLAPPLGCGVKDRGCVFRALPDHSAQPFARPGDPIFKDLATHYDGVMQTVRRVAKTRDQTVAVHDDGLGEPLAAALEPLDQRSRSVAEVAGECVAREAQLTSDRVALGADRRDGLLAARADPGHDLVWIQGQR